MATLSVVLIVKQKTISLNDFKAEIIIIEMLNVHCHTCQLQVPVFNQLWDTIQSDAVLKSKVAMVGITVGNTAQEIITFQKSFQPRYPVLADPLKEVFNSLSNPKGTPQTYLITKDPAGKWFILHHHRGAVDSHEIYLQKIKEFFKTSLEGVEPGYRVPQVLMQSLEKNYPAQSFDSQRILLYFPSTVTFPLETDSRNRENQMPVLRSLLGEENLALVIIGALNQLFPVAHALTDAYAMLGTVMAADVLGLPYYMVPMWAQYRHDLDLEPLSWFGNMPCTSIKWSTAGDAYVNDGKGGRVVVKGKSGNAPLRTQAGVYCNVRPYGCITVVRCMPCLPYSQDKKKFTVDAKTGIVHSEMNTPGIQMAYACRRFLQMVNETGKLGRVAFKPTQAQEDGINAGLLSWLLQGTKFKVGRKYAVDGYVEHRITDRFGDKEDPRVRPDRRRRTFPTMRYLLAGGRRRRVRRERSR